MTLAAPRKGTATTTTTKVLTWNCLKGQLRTPSQRPAKLFSLVLVLAMSNSLPHLAGR